MKVFISWSGELSKQLGQALRQWLPGTLQSVRPYFTPADVDKGAKWESEISKELEASGFCIIAMTKEALSSQWIVFEAGAVSKEGKKSRVCAICFDLKSTDMKGPLTTFQAIQWTKAEFRQLVDGINKASGDVALAETVLAEVFEERWPKLEAQVSKILKSGVSPKETVVRSERELLEEAVIRLRAMQGVNEKLSALADGFFVPRGEVNQLALAKALRDYQPTGTSLPQATSTHEPPTSILGALGELFQQPQESPSPSKKKPRK
jgi:hypothetical protein